MAEKTGRGRRRLEEALFEIFDFLDFNYLLNWVKFKVIIILLTMHKTFGDSFKIPLNTTGSKDAFAFPKSSRF